MSWHREIITYEARYDYEHSESWKDTEKLKEEISVWRNTYIGIGLSLEIFERISDWKLRNQRGRTAKHREKISSGMLESVTRCAFGLEDENKSLLSVVRIDILRALPGVGMGLATAILALTFPEEYGIIDRVNWKFVTGEDKDQFTCKQYIEYSNKLNYLKQLTGWSLQKSDFMVWSKAMGF